MTDRERVKYDIERCISHVPDACRDCSHYGQGEEAIRCMENLMAAALSLLKEQEEERLKFIETVARLTAENEMMKWKNDNAQKD